MSQNQRRSSLHSTTAARTNLLEAAASLLASGGTSAATSRAIAESAGENLGAITYYFGSKQDLISAAHVSTARRLVSPVIDELTNNERDPADKLLRAVQMLYRILDEHEDQLAGYLQSLTASCHNERVRAEINELHRNLIGVLQDEMAVQQTAGLIPDWVQPVAMAQLIVALVNGVTVSVATDPDRTIAAAIGAQFTQLLLSVRPNQTGQPHQH